MVYNFENCEVELKAFTNMVKKVRPNFDPESHYVLWIMSEFFDNHFLYDVDATVTLCDKNENEIDMLPYLTEKAKPITRTPYYNKCIRQAGIQIGRKRVFGIPLIFDDYHEIEKIAKIKVHWNIVNPMFLPERTQKPINLRLITLDVVHNLSFDFKDVEKNHWFSLYHKDVRFGDYREYVDDDMKAYSTCIAMYNYRLKLDYDTISEKSDSDCEYAKFENNAFTEYELKIFDELKNQSTDDIIEKARKYGRDDLHLVTIDDEFFMDCYYYERAIILNADPYPDHIIPEEGFGFSYE